MAQTDNWCLRRNFRQGCIQVTIQHGKGEWIAYLWQGLGERILNSVSYFIRWSPLWNADYLACLPHFCHDVVDQVLGSTDSRGLLAKPTNNGIGIPCHLLACRNCVHLWTFLNSGYVPVLMLLGWGEERGRGETGCRRMTQSWGSGCHPCRELTHSLQHVDWHKLTCKTAEV